MTESHRSHPAQKRDLSSVASAVSTLIGASLITFPALMRHAWAAPHHAGWLPAVPSVLVPLMVPRVGASIKRALNADVAPSSGYDTGETPAHAEANSTGTDEHADLLATNATMLRELCALKAAYRELQNDAADRTAAAERLDHLAHHDPLTNLPNRILLMDRLAQALTFAKRANAGVLVIYLDLDHFKMINDTMGHAAGDRVLSEVASRIAGCMRSADTASRVGGDEFVLICSTTDGIDEAPQVAARVLAAISAPIDVFGTPVTLGASLGISLFPADGSDASDLIRKADTAMYCAKARGRNCFNLYTAEIQAGIERKIKLETELREAIVHDQFEVHYQPIVDMQSGHVSGAEALVRWRHPTRGLISPVEFIPFAEEHGLAAGIGACVLRAVCRQLKRFALNASDDFSISINVSPDEFRQTGFVSSLAAAIAASATEPRRLSVEFGEKTIVGDAAFAETLRDLQQLGVQVAIDDFGTGLSSLADMRHLRVQKLKIDRSFVRDIAGSAGDEAIAKTIVTLAHSLGMSVIAEGVETKEQVEKLLALGSDSLQGYLISHPLPAADFEQFACTYGSMRLAA